MYLRSCEALLLSKLIRYLLMTELTYFSLKVSLRMFVGPFDESFGETT
jgi:hypothetical protein